MVCGFIRANQIDPKIIRGITMGKVALAIALINTLLIATHFLGVLPCPIPLDP